MGALEHLTGAQLAFQGGALLLDFRQKRGHLAFTDDHLEPVREYDEDGVWDGFLVRLPNSELEAIRDFLNKWLPATTASAPEPQGVGGAIEAPLVARPASDKGDVRTSPTPSETPDKT